MAKNPPLPKDESKNPDGGSKGLTPTESNVPLWAFLTAATLFASLLFILYNEINSIRDNKLEDFQKRITTVETKIAPTEDFQKRITALETKFALNFDSSQKFQDDLQKRVTILETKLDSSQVNQSKNK